MINAVSFDFSEFESQSDVTKLLKLSTAAGALAELTLALSPSTLDAG